MIGGAKRAETLVSAGFPGLQVDLSTVFDFPLTDDEQAILDLQLREPPAATIPEV